jgi:diguanylate cyclase (GGDEF)-like protein
LRPPNGRFGHAAGDAVIRAVAETIGSAVRDTDRAARFGGEEFILLIGSTDIEGVVAQAERIRAAVEATPVMHAEIRIDVTISGGAAVLSDGERDIQSLIERADRALYRAKQNGRNQVCVAADQPSSKGQAV